MDRDMLRELQNADVFSTSGDKIGSVGQVYLDDHTEEPTFITVKTGLFGTKETFVPLDQAQSAQGGVTVPFEKDFVKDAPNVDADGTLTPDEERRIYEYYSMDYNGRRDGAAGHDRHDDHHRDDRAGLGRDHDRDDVRDGDRRDDHRGRDAALAGGAAGAAGGAALGRDRHDDHHRDSLRDDVREHDRDGSLGRDRHDDHYRDDVRDRDLDGRRDDVSEDRRHGEALRDDRDRGVATDRVGDVEGGAQDRTLEDRGDDRHPQGLRLRREVYTTTETVQVPVKRERVVMEDENGNVVQERMDDVEGGAQDRTVQDGFGDADGTRR